MTTQQNYPLSKLTSFRIGGECSYFIEAKSVDEVIEGLKFAKEKQIPYMIIGGGNNLLVSDDGFLGVVIKISIVHQDLVFEKEGKVTIKAGAGNNWDELVAFAVEHGLWGMENLSNIPSSVGAIPVQNVGAYGQEASEIVDKIEALDVETLKPITFTNKECNFGYRSSNFNTVWKYKYAITSITFKLNALGAAKLDYIDLKKYFAEHLDKTPDLVNVRNAIIEIRKNKFPDTKQLGNAGSFFKNLILSKEEYLELEDNIAHNFGAEAKEKLIVIKNKFPQENGIKIPTAFLIELCGLKGKEMGKAKLWEKQPLVIVNTGEAKATDVIALYKHIKQVVHEKTGATLHPEPEFIGFLRNE